MIRFNCDYSEGCHPRILERMLKTNFEQTAGYGEDPYCKQAAALIREKCRAPGAGVHFLVGGTQTNLTVIGALLRPHEGVLAADCGHIGVHETGAIEATGHKVLPLPSKEGKITAAQVEGAVLAHRGDPNHEHMVKPGMVYLSHPTESGALYTKAELTAISEVCHKLGLVLYVDGARLGYGLMALGNDLFLPDLAELTDLFYIGGTKVGALFGEALVISNPALKPEFRYHIKQRGGMLAKGRLLGIQFLTLMEDGLYEELGAHADRLALRIKEGFAAQGAAFLADSRTNQQFPILTEGTIGRLKEQYAFEFWEPVGEGKSAVRFCTSWATREEDVDRLIRDVETLKD